MQRQLLKRSQNRINKSDSEQYIMMIVLVLLFRWNDDLCSSIRDPAHTAHCNCTHTQPFIQASINRNSTMVSTHIRSAEGRKTHTHTDSSYMKFSRVPLHVFWSFTTGKSGDFSSVASRLFSPGILIKSALKKLPSRSKKTYNLTTKPPYIFNEFNSDFKF